MPRHEDTSTLLSAGSDEKQVVGDVREQAFRRHYDRIYRYLRHRTHDDHEAEELAQMVFVEAAARLEQFKPGATPVLAWLYTVAQRRLVDRARVAARRHETISDLDAARLAPVDDLDFGVDVARAIGDALRRLPEKQRQVAVMKLLEGRSWAEVTERVGASEAACKMRFARALEALQADLHRQGIAP
ncbi:MAG TPA: RNA polymerase sigma factor [Gaiella sp.]|nr:RNA polymerase sigma factor [Gaiella sp.]